MDLFAGPGGLGEGFSSYLEDDAQPRFESVAAIERDRYSHETLLLRHFFREFRHGEAPDDYYRYLAGDIERDELFEKHPEEYRSALDSAICLSLGPDNHARVRKLIDNKLSGAKKWALVGGPPCQAYSLVGRSRMARDPEFEQDERHFLYREYLKIIADHRPPVFVMENVKGLLSAQVDGEPVVSRIIADLQKPKEAINGTKNGLGYRLYSLSEAEAVDGETDPRLFLVKAEEFGVPQARHRMFILGIRNDLDVRPSRLKAHEAPTVRQTIGKLPAIRSGVSREADSAERWQEEIASLSGMSIGPQLNGAPYAKAVASEIKLQLKAVNQNALPRSSVTYLKERRSNHQALHDMRDDRLKTLSSHEARAHMASDLRRYMYAAVFASVTRTSPKLADFPPILLPDHRNVEEGRQGKMFSDRFRVQLADEVSTTVTSHISKDGHYFIHYDPLQCRSLTVREAARLQTFPDNYKFEGPRTSQYHQVGNAVPPYLARQIAAVVAELLDRIGEET